MSKKRRGKCLCGTVRFSVSVPDPTFSICHCDYCRRWCGGPLMSVHCPGDATFDDDASLRWYRSSDWAERGFCGTCGSSLFWRLADDPGAMLIVAVDAFEDAGDISLHRHIYVDKKPGRYDFSDRQPRITEAELMAELGITGEGE